MTFFVKRSELLLFWSLRFSNNRSHYYYYSCLQLVSNHSRRPVFWLVIEPGQSFVCVEGGRVYWSSVPLLPAFTLPYNPELQTASTCPRYICLELPEWENVHSTPQSWTHIRAVRSVYTEEPNWTWANVGSEGYAAMNGKLRHTLT